MLNNTIVCAALHFTWTHPLFVLLLLLLQKSISPSWQGCCLLSPFCTLSLNFKCMTFSSPLNNLPMRYHTCIMMARCVG
jgi:hypothetical protein